MIALSEAFFLKNALISDKKFVTLCAGIGVMRIFVWYLKFTHFLRHMQESNAFFVSIYSRLYQLPETSIKIYYQKKYGILNNTEVL